MVSRHVLQPMLLALLLAAPLAAQEGAGAPAAPAPEAAASDPFAVPDGNDSKVLSLYLQRLAQTPPPVQTEEGLREHLLKIDKVLAEILSRQLEDEMYANTAELRLSILSFLPRVGDVTGQAKFQRFLDELRKDKRPAIQQLAARVDLQTRIGRIMELPSDEKVKLINELAEMIRNAPKDDPNQLGFAVQTSLSTAQQLEHVDPANALLAYQTFLKELQDRKDERLASLITVIEPSIRRLSLPGKPVEISGTTLDGKPFDMKQLQGKVVLVDFWATWCGPCMMEMPHVKEMYAAYHDKGFEVVGISLDEEDKEAMSRFIKDNGMTWINLFQEDPEKRGWNNPIANYYGVTAIPTTILVDQKGLVFSLNARGEQLTEALAKLLGPVEAAGK